MTTEPRPFKFFNPARRVKIHQGNLPHWNQLGATYFVTFRTADSIPQILQQQWHAQRHKWLLHHGINPLSSDWRDQLNSQPDLEDAYNRKFTRRIMGYLDQGHGRCVLAQPRIADIVADSLLHFDNVRYYLADFVIMPNHVHVLVRLLGTTEIEGQCRSWKTFSARAINS